MIGPHEGAMADQMLDSALDLAAEEGFDCPSSSSETGPGRCSSTAAEPHGTDR